MDGRGFESRKEGWDCAKDGDLQRSGESIGAMNKPLFLTFTNTGLIGGIHGIVYIRLYKAKSQNRIRVPNKLLMV